MNKIPKFKSREEEALFWDTHSTEDFPEYWQETKNVKFSKKLTSTFDHLLPMRLDEQTKEGLSKVAKDKGVGLSTAARILIRERLSELRII